MTKKKHKQKKFLPFKRHLQPQPVLEKPKDLFENRFQKMLTH